MSLSDYWRLPPKPDNALPENGEYYCRAGQGLIKQAHEGTSEFLEIPVTVEEGPYMGEEVKIAYFYLSRGKEVTFVLDKVKRISDQMGEHIRGQSSSPYAWLETVLNLLAGRKVKIKQANNKDGKTYLDILEVYDADMGQTLPAYQDAPPLADDIPF